MPESGLRHRLRIGYYVFGVLITIKVAEYLVTKGIRSGAWPYLTVLALAGAWLIIYYFMHISQIWRPGRKEDD